MPPVRNMGRSEVNSPRFALSAKEKAPEGGASDTTLRGFSDAQIRLMGRW